MLEIKQKNGFALIMTLIVIGVVVSVGLTILDLTIKQLNLSTNAKSSEIAFHAANAGVECIQFWRFEKSDEFENGDNNIDIECFDENDSSSVSNLGSGSEEIYEYEYEFDWGATGAERCSQIKMLVFKSDPDDGDITLNNIKTFLPGYENNDKTCESGGLCTIVSSRGYNKECSNVGDFGTIQREVLLEF